MAHRIISKQDLNKERAEHPGQSRYKIFKKDSAGNRITVSEFWATDDNEAMLTLDVFKQKKQLVDPSDSTEYFYGTAGGFLCETGNGMYIESDELGGLHDDKDETILEKFGWFFRKIGWWFRDMKYAFIDFWFWFKHYDKKTNKSHQRFESWNLDGAILDMLEFNIPIIKQDKHGIPTEFCMKARQFLHKDEPDFDIEQSFKKNPNVNDKTEMPIAEKLWHEELDRLLLHIRLYQYYSDSGYIDSNDPIAVEIDKKYRSTLPYKPGTDNDFDYVKLSELTQIEWKAIWTWMTEYGQMLWT